MKRFISLFLILALALACFGCAAGDASSSTSSAVQESPSEEPSSSAAETSPPSETSSVSPLPSESSAEDPQTVYPITVTDMEGFESVIDAADSVVSLTTSSTQILIAEGALKKIVGVDAYSADFAPEAEVVGDYIAPDVEKIVSLEPDVIIAANAIQKDSIEQLRSFGIPVVAAEPTTWEQVPESFELIGRIVNAQAEARNLSDQLAQTVDEARNGAPAESPTAYYVLSFGDAGNWTSGEGSFINAMMEIAGATPVTQGSGSPWLEYPMEDLVEADPDCVILGSAAGSLEDFAKTPGYADLTAVREGRVYGVDSDLVTIPGPHLREGLAKISQIVSDAADALVDEAA